LDAVGWESTRGRGVIRATDEAETSLGKGGPDYPRFQPTEDGPFPPASSLARPVSTENTAAWVVPGEARQNCPPGESSKRSDGAIRQGNLPPKIMEGLVPTMMWAPSEFQDFQWTRWQARVLAEEGSREETEEAHKLCEAIKAWSMSSSLLVDGEAAKLRESQIRQELEKQPLLIGASGITMINPMCLTPQNQVDLRQVRLDIGWRGEPRAHKEKLLERAFGSLVIPKSVVENLISDRAGAGEALVRHHREYGVSWATLPTEFGAYLGRDQQGHALVITEGAGARRRLWKGIIPKESPETLPWRMEELVGARSPEIVQTPGGAAIGASVAAHEARALLLHSSGRKNPPIEEARRGNLKNDRIFLAGMRKDNVAAVVRSAEFSQYLQEQIHHLRGTPQVSPPSERSSVAAEPASKRPAERVEAQECEPKPKRHLGDQDQNDCGPLNQLDSKKQSLQILLTGLFEEVSEGLTEQAATDILLKAESSLSDIRCGAYLAKLVPEGPENASEKTPVEAPKVTADPVDPESDKAVERGTP